MQNDLGVKLIAVADIRKLTLFLAQGIKITEKLSEVNFDIDGHHKGNKSESHIHKGGLNGGINTTYEPHTSPSEIEHKQAAHLIYAELEQAVATHHQIKEIIIVADPKSLGFIRHEMKPNFKKLVTKEIAKDLTHHSKSDIETIIFKWNNQLHQDNEAIKQYNII